MANSRVKDSRSIWRAASYLKEAAGRSEDFCLIALKATRRKAVKCHVRLASHNLFSPHGLGRGTLCYPSRLVPAGLAPADRARNFALSPAFDAAPRKLAGKNLPLNGLFNEVGIHRVPTAKLCRCFSRSYVGKTRTVQLFTQKMCSWMPPTARTKCFPASRQGDFPQVLRFFRSARKSTTFSRKITSFLFSQSSQVAPLAQIHSPGSMCLPGSTGPTGPAERSLRSGPRRMPEPAPESL